MKRLSSLLMLLCMVCMGAWAQQNVAQIGEEEYATLQAAVAAVPADGTETTITMIANETILGNAGVTVPAGKNIVLDLNGKTVKNAVNENKGSQVILNKGTLSIKDSSAEGTGLLTNAIEEGSATGDWWSTPQYNYATNVITNNGTLTIKSGKIHETATSSICYAIDNNSSAADAILNLEGGLITTLAPTTIRMFCNSTTKENTLNMSEASTAVVESNGTSALYIQLPGSSAQKKKGTLNIAGGTLTGGSYAFYDYSYGDLYDEVKYNLSGGTYNGSYSFFSYGANIDITGGTYNGAVYIKQMKASEVSVSDGLFAGDIRTYGDNATEKFISGGKFANYTFVSQGTTYGCYWLYRIADGYDAYDNTDPATKDAYPYMVAPIKVRLEVHDEVEVTTNPEATPEEQEAANAAVEELSNNEIVTADDATNVAEMEDVHNLVISVVSASVDTKTEDEVTATITQVTYDVQPYKNDEKVNETAQPVSFRLPVPSSFTTEYVKVIHRHGQNEEVSVEKVLGTDPNKYVELSSQKFSEWTLEAIDESEAPVVITRNDNAKKLYEDGSDVILEDSGIKSVVVKRNVEANSITYTRTFNASAGSWQSWIVPFNVTAGEGYDSRVQFARIIQFAYLDEDKTIVSDPNDGSLFIVLERVNPGETVVANAPYVVKVPTAGEYEFVSQDNRLYVTTPKTIAANTTTTNFTFNGVYTRTTLSDIYMVATNGVFSHMTTPRDVNPYRWYFTAEPTNVYEPAAWTYPSNVRMLVLGEDELATSIMNALKNKEKQGVKFDVMGRMIQNQQNGLYIQNGKKYIK